MIRPPSLRRLRILSMAVAMLAFVACDRQLTPEEMVAQIPVPIDLDQRDNHLVEQYRQLRASLEAATAPEAPAEELIEALLDLGNWHHAFRDNDLAATCYRQGAALEPDALRWQYFLGRVLDTAGDADAAREALLRTLELHPNYVPALVILGELELREGQEETARALFARVLEVAPQNGRAHFGTAQMALDARDYPTALEHLEAALAQQPNATSVHYTLGLAHRGAGNLQAAAKHLDRAQIEGNNEHVTLELRDPLMERVRRFSRGRTNTQIRRAERLFDLGRYDEAAALISKSLETEGEQADLRFLLGLIKRHAGDTDGALAELRRTIGLQDDHAAAHYQIGLLLSRRGEHETAEHHFRSALDADPGHRHAGSRLGHLLRVQGRHDEAIDIFRQAIEVHNTVAASHFGLTASLAQTGRWSEARKHAEEGLRLVPTAHKLRHLLARLLASAPDAELRDGRRAVDLASVRTGGSVNVQQVETLAMAYAEVGNFDEATRWQQVALDAALRANPSADDGWIGRRLELYRAGRPSRQIWAEGEPKTLSDLPSAPATSDAG